MGKIQVGGGVSKEYEKEIERIFPPKRKTDNEIVNEEVIQSGVPRRKGNVLYIDCFRMR